MAVANVCMVVTNRGFDDPRVCMEAEALAQQGHALTVIGWDRDIDKDTDRTQNGVRFLGLRLRSTHGRGITQPLFLSGFWWRAWRVLRGLRPAVIHCHDLDTLPLGLTAARSLRARLVFDAHENFPDMMTGHLPEAGVSALRELERRLVPRCDLLITVGDRLAGHYRALGARKVEIVGNWKDPEAYRFEPEQLAHVRRELGLKDGVVAVCFIANLGRERPLEPLLAAIAEDKRFACVVGGNGKQADLVRRYAAEHGNIRYLGRVPPARVPLITCACDLIYAAYDPDCLNAQWGAPNKLFEAIVAGKPLLTNDLGEIGEIVRATGCGVLTDVSAAAPIRAALEQMLSGDARRAMGERASALSSRFQRSEGLRHLARSYAELDSPANGLPPLGEARASTDAGPAKRPRVLVAVTGGGFYREARRAASELHALFDVFYVTLAGVPYRTLWPELEGKCYTLSHYDARRCSPLTNAYRLSMALWQAYLILGDRRIRGVLVVGVNLAIPLGIAARLRGVPFIFVESMARVTQSSFTGRVVSLLNLADQVYVQWPEATRLYRRARYEGNTL